MAEKKHALLIFSKAPQPGKVKTRLTRKYGGFLSDEQAAEFFKMCLFDVCEGAMHALMSRSLMMSRDNIRHTSIATVTICPTAGSGSPAKLELPTTKPRVIVSATTP